MGTETLEKWVGASSSGSDSLRYHRFLNPPVGYVIGVVLWPVFLSFMSVWAVLVQTGLPSPVVTIGGIVLGIGGFVVTSISSALVMGVTAWNTPDDRLRRQIVFLCLSFFLAGLLFGLYLQWPTIPFKGELGVSTFVAHEVSKVALLGPAIGFTFVVFPLMVLVHRFYHSVRGHPSQDSNSSQ